MAPGENRRVLAGSLWRLHHWCLTMTGSVDTSMRCVRESRPTDCAQTKTSSQRTLHILSQLLRPWLLSRLRRPLSSPGFFTDSLVYLFIQCKDFQMSASRLNSSLHREDKDPKNDILVLKIIPKQTASWFLSALEYNCFCGWAHSPVAWLSGLQTPRAPSYFLEGMGEWSSQCAHMLLSHVALLNITGLLCTLECYKWPWI